MIKKLDTLISELGRLDNVNLKEIESNNDTLLYPIGQKNKELLVFGYIRSNKSTDKRIPIEITTLCNEYFIFSITWSILNFDKKLKKFKNELETSGYSDIVGPMFIVRKEIKLQLQLIATGDSNDYCLLFMIDWENLADLWKEEKIEAITAYYEIHCIEHKLFEKGTHKFFSMNHAINCDIDDIGLEHLNSLSFDVHIDILNKLYCDGQQSKNIYYKPIKFNKNINYKWNIDNFTLNKFKHSKKNETFYSKNFDSAWTMYCIPKYNNNNNDDSNRGLIRFGLCLLHLPPKITKLTVNVLIKNEYQTLIKNNHDLHLNDPFIDNRSILSISITEITKLIFDAKIDIVKVFVNDDEIAASQWNIYGII